MLFILNVPFPLYFRNMNYDDTDLIFHFFVFIKTIVPKKKGEGFSLKLLFAKRKYAFSPKGGAALVFVAQ